VPVGWMPEKIILGWGGGEGDGGEFGGGDEGVVERGRVKGGMGGCGCEGEGEVMSRDEA